MASDIVNIPICCVPTVLQRNCVGDFMQFVRMKALEGRWLQGEWCPKLLARMTRRGWLKLHDGKHYQVDWNTAFPLDERYTHAKISVDCLDDPKLFKAMLFVMGYLYLMSPQTQRRNCSRKKDNRQVNESKHKGGISHTICMPFFGFGKTWCHNMRKLCESLGLAAWTRRWVPVVPDPEAGLPEDYVRQLMEKTGGRYRMRDDGSIEEEVASYFTLTCNISLCVPRKYRSSVRKLYS
jgi:hypothetical protein